jgi:hypothetical protein
VEILAIAGELDGPVSGDWAGCLIVVQPYIRSDISADTAPAGAAGPELRSDLEHAEPVAADDVVRGVAMTSSFGPE